MDNDSLQKEETNTLNWLLRETDHELKVYRKKVITISVVVALVICGLIVYYWIRPTVTHSTSLSIGGLFYSLYGGLLLALQALSSPQTLAIGLLPQRIPLFKLEIKPF